MLVDPDFQNVLAENTPYTDQTLEFVKKVVKPLLYIDMTTELGVVTGQVYTGDGLPYENEVDIVMQVLGAAAVVSVDNGAAIYGNGTNHLWMATTGSGAFQVTVTASGATVLTATVNHGVTNMIQAVGTMV